MFIGTGEHLHDLERFSPRPFISKLLGMGDVQGLMEQMQDIQSTRDPKKQEAMMKKIEAGIFTIRDMKEQMSTVMSMGPLSKVANMIPGMGAMLNSAPGETDEEMGFKVKKIMFITDSMTTEELDSDGSLFVDSDSSGQPGYGYARPPNARILRVARGSGTTVREVEEVLAQHKMLGASPFFQLSIITLTRLQWSRRWAL
jgi:signal recognition particle subunit SRP54